jgi:hypothetical protein
MPRAAALKRLAELDEKLTRVGKDHDAMGALMDFYAKDPTGRAKVERERSQVARLLAALRDERTTVIAALGPDVELRDLGAAQLQLKEVETALAARTKAHQGLAVLVSMYASDKSRDQGRKKAENELADMAGELERLETRRDALVKLIAEIEASSAAAVPSSATAQWRLCVTENNEEYFYNPTTDETSWELPDGVVRDELLKWDDQSTTTTATADAAAAVAVDVVDNSKRNSGDELRSAGKWTAFWSRTEQSEYFYNSETDETTWDCPAELAIAKNK